MGAKTRNGRRNVAPTVVLLIALALVSACAPMPASSPVAPDGTPTGPFELIVVHSNDTWGYLDPCG